MNESLKKQIQEVEESNISNNNELKSNIYKMMEHFTFDE